MRRNLHIALICSILLLGTVAAAQQPRPVLWWGFGGQGESGYLGTNVPVHVAMPDAIAVAGGFYSSAVLTPDGRVWAWGSNGQGQLGDGTNANRATPAPVASLDHVIAIAAGSYHVLALKDDRTVWAWGFNQLGQLGDGTRTSRNVPSPVAGLADVVAIAAGEQHSLALTADGQLHSWGDDRRGQLGVGVAPGGFSVTPLPVSGLSNVAAIDAFADMSIAALSDGSVFTWGDNHLGQLGDGTAADRPRPVPNGIVNAIAVAAGGDAAAALLGDGSVATWGSNNHLMLGDGTVSSRFTPSVVPNLANVTRIDAGFLHMVALKQDGTVWVWGSNADWGQLGLGLPINYNTNVPVQVTAVTGVRAVAAGGESVLALGYLQGEEDTVPPSITCGPAPGGWQSGNVSIACSAIDAQSGLAVESDATFTLSTSVPTGVENAAASTGMRQVCDLSGNCATAGPIGGISVDRRAPTISLTAPAGTYTVNQAATVSYTCVDGGSGVVSCAGPVASGAPVSTSSPGSFAFAVTSADGAGNEASASRSYTVGYAICPQYDGTKAVKSGATIPIKLKACDAAGANLSSAEVVVHALSVVQVSTNASFEVQDAGNANPDADFRFASGLYIFNLQTTGLATGSYVLTFTAGADPTTHTAPFQVR